MQIKTIEVKRSARVNLGNYEGAEYTVGMTAEIDELDSEAEATHELTGHVERAIAVQIYRSSKVRKSKKFVNAEAVCKHFGFTHLPTNIPGETPSDA